jgi:glycosyltransferase involved in cell wall biosynthesis
MLGGRPLRYKPLALPPARPVLVRAPYHQPYMSMADTSSNAAKMSIALVYWGRLGAGAALMSQIADAMRHDARFGLFLSPSLQSELPPQFPTDRLLPVRTFSGPLSLLARTFFLPLTVNRLVRDLSARNVRAIVTIMPHVWGLALQRAARRAGIRTLLIVHDADPHPGERRPVFDWLVGREIRASDRVITFSNHVADRLAARGDVPEDRIARLFHPIFRFGGKPTERGRPFRLLFFGRILPYKGVTMLLDAFARLRTAGIDISLNVVGRGEIDAPHELRTQPGLTIKTGWVAPDAIGGILAEADAVALPYLEASQSGVIAAAYGAGLPVIATPVGGLAEQVADGVTGVLAGSTSAADFAEAIRRLIETPGLYGACRSGVIAHAETESLEHFAAALGDTVVATVTSPSRD